jgi:hypothetical protein
MVWAALLCPPAWAQEAAQGAVSVRQPLITQAVDESQLTTLKGNTHPLARPQYDLGAAPASLPLERMLLVLKRSPEQEYALTKLLDNQQDKGSPSYHQWLTPEEFGKQFGPTDYDMQIIVGWLQAHGFQVAAPSKGRTVIEFSGSASQVQEAFHTTIHKYLVNGEQHWANDRDPSIPTALTPAVAGIFTLHNFLMKPQYVLSKEKGTVRPGNPPQVTTTTGTHGLVPGDYAVIYNIPAYTSSTNGSGITIGVIAESEILLSDFSEYLSLFSLTSNTPNIIVNGPDPGDVPGADVEGTLDATWSQLIAPGATVDFVVSASTDTTAGIDLSELYIIENNLANVMTESFGGCEAFAGDSQVAGIANMAEQAAAQGISYMVSSGDNGAEGCDDPNSESVASGPISVNVLASTPFTVAVGGTVFNENGRSTYWNSTNTTNGVSALSYIPEDVWNDSCVLGSCPSGVSPNIWAGSGGASLGNTSNGGTFTGFPAPSWQSGVTGLPPASNPTQRYLPDVSLTASTHDGYVLCFQGSCASQEFYLIGGTSASAPSFAGIMALVDQKMGRVQGTSGERQGQPDYVLYPLAATENSNFSNCNGSSQSGLPASTCIFNDVTVGNNEVPGEAGYPSAPYSSGVGYDGASGLGSVNVANLISKWASATFRPTTTTLTLSPTTGITHGTTSVNVTITVAPKSGTGKPSGDVTLIASVGGANGGPSSVLPEFTLTGGTFSGTTLGLPGGTSYNVTAHYAGDGTFAPSDSTAKTVTVTPENSATTLICQSGANCASTFNSSGNFATFGANSTIPYGDLVYLHVAVAGASGNGVPTGTVSIFDNATQISGSPYTLSSDGTTDTPTGLFNLPAGSQSITASYIGDHSFSSSTSTPFAFTIAQAATAITVTPAQTTISAGGTDTLTANFTLGTTTLPSFGNAPTGTVTFTCSSGPSGCNGASLGSGSVTGTAGSGNVQNGSFTAATATASMTTTAGALPIGSDTITAVYNGDSNYAASPVSPGVVVTVQGPDFSLTGGTVTMTQGTSQPVTITVNALNGFTGTVGNFTCTVASLPAETSCGPANPSTVTGSGTTTITVTTTALGQMRRRAANESRGIGWMASAVLPLLGVCLIGIPAWGRRRRALPVLMMVALLVLMPSCGGGGGGGGQQNNPVPSITSLSPTQQAAGSQSQTLTINGANFMSSSTVTYNNVAHTATYVSASQLTIPLTASDMQTQGNYPVVVTNPTPGGGASNSVKFDVVSGTPVGTFNVTVTATSGSTQHSTTFTLTVQ